MLNRDHLIAVQCGQKAYAGVDCLEGRVIAGLAFALGIPGHARLSDGNGAGSAVTLIAAFFGAGQSRILAQPVQEGARWRRIINAPLLAIHRELDHRHLAVAPIPPFCCTHMVSELNFKRSARSVKPQ